jgi:hypothetical protein
MSPTNGKNPSEKVIDHLGRIAGTVAAIALFFANIAAIVTHVENLRLWLLPTLGLAGLQSVHYYLVAMIASAAIVGFVALSYWMYRRYVIERSDGVKIVYILGSCVCYGDGSVRHRGGPS